jgi:hypothetical protein
MSLLGHSQAETVALRPQHGCFKIESPLTLVVAPQFSTVPVDSNSAPRRGIPLPNLEDALGQPATLRLTSACVQQLVMTLPHLLSKALKAQHHGDGSIRAVFPLSEWRLEAAAGSKDFILSMMTPDGFEVAFSLSEPTIPQITSALSPIVKANEQ